MRAGRKVVLVPPAYTTMTCSECGEKQARLGLAERTFQCLDCGYTADRDRNAARVILATAERGRAGADDVRHSLTSFRARAACDLSQKSPRRQSQGIVKTGVSQTAACPWSARDTCLDRGWSCRTRSVGTRRRKISEPWFPHKQLPPASNEVG